MSDRHGIQPGKGQVGPSASDVKAPVPVSGIKGPEIDTHHKRILFGKHKGERWTRLPPGYLRWLSKSGNADVMAMANAELARRGTTFPEIEISGHAIDRASLSLRDIWHQTREDSEGLHSWLCRMAMDAIRLGKTVGDRIHYAGIKFAFNREFAEPVLLTVMRDDAPNATDDAAVAAPNTNQPEA